MNKGFIMLERDFLDEDFYLSEKFTRPQAFIDLCFQAAYKERTFRIRGISMELKPRELAISENNLALRWRWSRNTVRKFLSELVADGYIEQKTNNVVNVITIKKYLVVEQQNEQGNGVENRKFVGSSRRKTEHEKEQENKQQNEHPIIIDNNENKDIKEKEDKSSKKRNVFVKPNVEEIWQYIEAQGYHVDAERFYNYYESKGWVVGKSPMKDWKAAVRTWEGNAHEQKPKANAAASSADIDVVGDDGKVHCPADVDVFEIKYRSRTNDLWYQLANGNLIHHGEVYK